MYTLNESQLLLCNLVYRPEFSNIKYENTEVGYVLNVAISSRDQAMTAEEWNEIFTMAGEDEQISNLTVTDMYREKETGVKMACFVDKDGQAYAVFAGTDKVKECYAFDGEGFSAEFCDKYQDEITQKKNSIHLTSHYRDFVNTLLYPIAGDVKYVVNEKGIESAAEYHAPNSMFKFKDGKIPSKIAEGDVYSQKPTMEMINGYTIYILENASESEKIVALSVLGEILTGIIGGKNGITREDILEKYGSEGIDVILRFFTSYKSVRK